MNNFKPLERHADKCLEAVNKTKNHRLSCVNCLWRMAGDSKCTSVAENGVTMLLMIRSVTKSWTCQAEQAPTPERSWPMHTKGNLGTC